MGSEPRTATYHVYVGDGNDGTGYDHTICNCPTDAIEEYLLECFIKPEFWDDMQSDSDGTVGSLYLLPYGDGDFCPVVIDYFMVDSDGNAVREPCYGTDEREYETPE